MRSKGGKKTRIHFSVAFSSLSGSKKFVYFGCKVLHDFFIFQFMDVFQNRLSMKCSVNEGIL